MGGQLTHMTCSVHGRAGLPPGPPGPPRSSAFAAVYLAGLLQRLSTVNAEGWQAGWQMRECRSRAALAKIMMREGELSRVRVFKGHP